MPFERHDDHFGPNRIVQDWEWIDYCSDNGWVGLTRDWHFRYDDREKTAILRGGATIFVLIGKYPHLELAQNFVQLLPKVYAFLEEYRDAPFIAKIYRSEPRVKMWASASDLSRKA